MAQQTFPVLCGSIAGKAGTVGARMHAAGYAYLGLDYTYVAFGVADAKAALDAMRTLGIRGFGVTMPFKVQVLPFLDEVDPMARTIGAVNTIVNEGGRLIGYNVDWLGAVRAIEEQTTIAGKRVVVVGAGGAGRAIAAGMKHESAASVRIYNRTPEKAREMAADLGCEFGGDLAALARAGDFDLLVQTTSVGFRNVPPAETVVPPDLLQAGRAVLDVISEPAETLLLKQARAAGCLAIPGYRMRVHQSLLQFTLYTGRELPIEVMEKAMFDAMGVQR